MSVVKPTEKVPHPTCKPCVLLQLDFSVGIAFGQFQTKDSKKRAIDESRIRIEDQEL